MKKFFTGLVTVLMALAFLCPAAMATNYDYQAQVYKQTSTNIGDVVLEEINSGITFQVLTINSDTAATITKFGDDAATSVTNPVTTTNFASATVCAGKVRFRTTASTVDLLIVDTSGGFSLFVEDFSPYKHKLVIDERPNVIHHGCIWFSASSAAETDTGVDFLADTFIHDVRPETVTVDAGETIDVGLLSTETAGDANGLRALTSVATAGFTSDTGIITNGSTIDYTAVTTYGVLLYTAITGSDAVATCGGRTYIGHIVTASNATSLTYTGTAGSDTAAGYIHYWFSRMR